MYYRRTQIFTFARNFSSQTQTGNFLPKEKQLEGGDDSLPASVVDLEMCGFILCMHNHKEHFIFTFSLEAFFYIMQVLIIIGHRLIFPDNYSIIRYIWDENVVYFSNFLTYWVEIHLGSPFGFKNQRKTGQLKMPESTCWVFVLQGSRQWWTSSTLASVGGGILKYLFYFLSPLLNLWMGLAVKAVRRILFLNQ